MTRTSPLDPQPVPRDCVRHIWQGRSSHSRRGWTRIRKPEWLESKTGLRPKKTRDIEFDGLGKEMSA